jgi:hypothetical protein
MTEMIKTIGKKAARIKTTGRPLPRIAPAEFAAARGADPYRIDGPRADDPIALAAIGHELVKCLRSTGGRPALQDANEICKVPLSHADVAALENLTRAVEDSSGVKPSLGQVASAILRIHLHRPRRGDGKRSSA